ncbi:MAG: outer membrane beta-barrel protein [Parachlamydiaceae bacterium]|nr:MAG: outer membrane beta-barrel protein [Parachlamydiaceae bacterium]
MLCAPALGFYLSRQVRIEGEFAYRYNKLQRLRYHGESFHPKGHLETFSGLINAYYEIPICWCLIPYVGAGMDYAYTRDKVTQGYSFQGEDSKSGMAWQVIGGAVYPLCFNLGVGFEYRFFQNTQLSKVQNHAIGSTIKYSF